MLAILGILLVFAAVIGGFLMEQGNPWVLMQPAELLIICGAGAGIVLVSNSPARNSQNAPRSSPRFSPARPYLPILPRTSPNAL